MSDLCHHSNCRRFKCACGRTHQWSWQADPHWFECECGRQHARGAAGPKLRANGSAQRKPCEGITPGVGNE